MSNKIMHPTLRLLGAPLETTDGDFKDMAHCHTVLGDVGFVFTSRNQWEWNLVTVQRGPADFDDVVSGGGVPSLEIAVVNAERTLGPLVRIAERASWVRGFCFAVSSGCTALRDFKRSRQLLAAGGIDSEQVRKFVTVDTDLLLALVVSGEPVPTSLAAALEEACAPSETGGEEQVDAIARFVADGSTRRS